MADAKSKVRKDGAHAEVSKQDVLSTERAAVEAEQRAKRAKQALKQAKKESKQSSKAARKARKAAKAAHKAVQLNPGHSISYMLLAASLAKLGRLQQARVAAARVLELQPAFRYSQQFAGVDCAPALADALSESLHAVGLPE